MAAFPKRGQIYLVNINPETGVEEDAPVAVVQNDVGNRYAKTVIVALIDEGGEPTFDLEIFLPKEESGLEKDGVIRTDRIFTLDKSTFARSAGRLSAATAAALNEGLSISLGLVGL